MNAPFLHPFSWERVIRAVEAVRERLLRATAALETAGVPYAVIGGNAVAAWVRRAGEGGERNTPNVDLLLRRPDLAPARTALEQAGFLHRHVEGRDVFLDDDRVKVRSAVRIWFAGEPVRPRDLLPTPDVSESEVVSPYRVITLAALVRMKLVSNRCIDRVHLCDMLGVGLIDASWCARLPPELAARLQELLVDPEG